MDTNDPHTNHDDLRFWIGLLRTPGVGIATYHTLLETVETPRAVFGQTRTALTALGLSDRSVTAIANPDWGPVERDLLWLEQPGHHLLTLHDTTYPALLKNIPAPPPLLFVHGSPAALHTPQIAVVGSRNPSLHGRNTAHRFAGALTRVGLSITSGLALGIDAAGHRGALDSNGITLAVAGTGPDTVYPATNRALACEIVESGAIVTEFPPGTPPRAHHFPRRNRIISGMSVGTLVIEAAKQSGSLITARQSIEQGREVFAIPGSIHNPLARGCNALIRQGAKLVETVEDILEEIGPLTATTDTTGSQFHGGQTEPEDLTAEYRLLLKAIDDAPTTIDALVESTGRSPEDLASMLLVLELRGLVAAVAGGAYCRARSLAERFQ